MDLNSDGNKDLLTGCFEGGLYWVEGLDEGKFAEPAKVLDQEGDVLRIGQYWGDEEKKWMKSEEELGISGFAVDYDDDGDLDLLLGSNDGHIHVRINQGSATEPEWSKENVQIVAQADSDSEDDESEPLDTGGHAMPCAFDFDGDGLFDIITGSNTKGVMWSKNVGTQGEPEFGALVSLIKTKDVGDGDAKVGTRLQASAGDFNQDGVNDILVGDYRSVSEDNRTDEEKDRYGELSRETSKAVKKLAKLAARKEKIEDKDELEELEAEIDELNEQLGDNRKEQRAIAAKRKSTRHGYVWLFLGK